MTEDALDSQAWNIGHNGPLWIQQNIIAVKNPLARNKGIQNIITLQAKVDELSHEIEEAEEREEKLNEDQEQLLKLIPAGHTDQVAEWKTELSNNRKLLVQLQRETLPALKKKRREAEKAVSDALNDLTANWSEKVKIEANGQAEPVGAEQ